ncbi:hypothetical protein KO495_08840 [Colwellia sp. D2M02]|uniref:DUF3311 domain-containing protein n=1 Tax=Colwellia asteriadis TaxID=517723 RepID=A0ABN1L477_9GAMM|nr:hypothetical protein [Colwellia sp. D2M02]MBU2893435.1 hypothetical protein [Colwellia sp. D2M02]
MNSVRYTLLVILVLLFSWPVIAQLQLSIWALWLYPFALWLLVILCTVLYDNNKNSEHNNDQ